MMIYTSTDFDPNQSPAYSLLVRAGEGESTLAIVDQQGQLKLVAVYQPNSIGEDIEDILALDFAVVKLSVPESHYTFIPEEVFDAEKLAAYLPYLPDDGLTATTVSRIKSHDIRLLYQTDKRDIGGLISRFPQVITYPVIQVLLNGFARERIQEDRSVLILDRHGDTLTVICFDNGKFVYANDFKIVEDIDVNYYLQSVLSHLNVDITKLLLILSGDIQKTDEIYQWASESSEEVRFVDSASFTGVTIPEELQSIQHQFFTLLGLHQCE